MSNDTELRTLLETFYERHKPYSASLEALNPAAQPAMMEMKCRDKRNEATELQSIYLRHAVRDYIARSSRAVASMV